MQAVRRADGLERHAGPAQRRLYDAGLLALRRIDGRAKSSSCTPQLYHLPPEKIAPRIEELLERYDLKTVVNARPDSLPLGIKQRLQLAVAVLHEPSILILDEPTSGVDPIARDAFWRTLIDLSRDDGVTIFVTTHFMNEADRCDRISLMHAGKVLAVGAPQELVKERGSASLEDCFVGYLAEAAGIDMSKKAEALAPSAAEVEAIERPKRFSLGRLWAYARRETVELLRDPIRLAFALVGPIILMLAFGYGISFDIENLETAAFDQDDTPQSRDLLQGFEGSRYFSVQPPIASAEEMERRLKSGNTQIVVEVPPGFGRDLLNKRTPEVDATVDGAMTFRGETSKNYVTGVVRKQGEELHAEPCAAQAVANAWKDDDIQTRFRYNQAFLSVNAMVPSIFMLLLCLIPAIMSAIAVVREKETGSIANFRSTPITRFEFLIGKQLPYIAVSMIAFFALLLMAIFIFRVPVKGPFLVLLVGTLVYVIRDHGLRRADLVLHPDAGRGRLRNGNSLDRAGRQFLRNARAGLLALGRGEGPRPVVPLVLVPADFGRRVRQGARLRRPVARHRRDRAHRARLPRRVARLAPQAGGVRCPRLPHPRSSSKPSR